MKFTLNKNTISKLLISTMISSTSISYAYSNFDKTLDNQIIGSSNINTQKDSKIIGVKNINISGKVDEIKRNVEKNKEINDKISLKNNEINQNENKIKKTELGIIIVNNKNDKTKILSTEKKEIEENITELSIEESNKRKELDLAKKELEFKMDSISKIVLDNPEVWNDVPEFAKKLKYKVEENGFEDLGLDVKFYENYINNYKQVLVEKPKYDLYIKNYDNNMSDARDILLKETQKITYNGKEYNINNLVYNYQYRTNSNNNLITLLPDNNDYDVTILERLYSNQYSLLKTSSKNTVKIPELLTKEHNAYKHYREYIDDTRDKLPLLDILNNDIQNTDTKYISNVETLKKSLSLKLDKYELQLELGLLNKEYQDNPSNELIQNIHIKTIELNNKIKEVKIFSKEQLTENNKLKFVGGNKYEEYLYKLTEINNKNGNLTKELRNKLDYKVKNIQKDYDKINSDISQNKSQLNIVNKQLKDNELTDEEKLLDTKYQKLLSDKKSLEDGIRLLQSELINIHENGENSIILGDNNVNSGNNSIIIGNKSENFNSNSIVIGHNSKNFGPNSTIIGNNIENSEDNVFVIANKNQPKRILGVREGELSNESTEAINGAQLFKISNNLVQSIDKNAIIDKDGNVNNIDIVINDKKFTNIKDALIEVSNSSPNINLKNEEKNLTLTESKDKKNKILSLNEKDVKFDEIVINNKDGRISGIKDGLLNKDSTDAVTGKQLFKTNSNVNINKVDIANINNIMNSSIFKISANNGTAYNVTNNSNVNLGSISKNIIISENNGNFNFDIANTLNIKESILINGSKVLTESDDISNGVVKYSKVEGEVDKNNIVLEGIEGTTISNLKKADISKNSTEAVSGSQLFETNQNISKNKTDIYNLSKSVNDGSIGISVNNGESQKIIKDGVINFSNTDENVIISRENASIKFNLSDNINVKNTITVGNTKISGDQIIINGDRVLTESDRFDSDLINDVVRYEKHNNGEINKSKIKLDGENGTIITNLKDGLLSIDSTDAINGGQITKISTNIAKYIDKDVKIDENGNVTNINLEVNNKNFKTVKEVINEIDTLINQNNPSNIINIGGDLDGKEINVASSVGNRVISGIEDGINDNDATNIRQLNNVTNNINNINTSLNNKIDKVDRKLSKGIAASASLNIQYPEQKPGQVAVGANLGWHGSDQAIAIGGKYVTESGNVSLNTAISRAFGSDAKTTGTVGVGFVF